MSTSAYEAVQRQCQILQFILQTEKLLILPVSSMGSASCVVMISELSLVATNHPKQFVNDQSRSDVSAVMLKLFQRLLLFLTNHHWKNTKRIFRARYSAQTSTDFCEALCSLNAFPFHRTIESWWYHASDTAYGAIVAEYDERMSIFCSYFLYAVREYNAKLNCVICTFTKGTQSARPFLVKSAQRWRPGRGLCRALMTRWKNWLYPPQFFLEVPVLSCELFSSSFKIKVNVFQTVGFWNSTLATVTL